MSLLSEGLGNATCPPPSWDSPFLKGKGWDVFWETPVAPSVWATESPPPPPHQKAGHHLSRPPHS